MIKIIIIIIIIFAILVIVLKDSHKSTENCDSFMEKNFYIPLDDIDLYEKEMPANIGCETIYDGKHFIVLDQDSDNGDKLVTFIFREINDECINVLRQTSLELLDFSLEEDITQKLFSDDYQDRNLVIIKSTDGNVEVSFKNSNREYFDNHPEVIIQRNKKEGSH